MRHEPIQTLNLADTELLRGVPEPDLSLIVADSAPRWLSPGEVLLSPTRENVHVYVLLSGALGLHFGGPSSPEVRELTAGTSVGEMSVIDATLPSAWVVAKEACLVLPIHRDLVKRLIEEASPVARNLVRLLTRWIRANTHRIVLDQAQIWELSNHANIDPLTGLYNRRWLDNAFTRLLEQSRKQGRPTPLSALMIDVDHFKEYNDAHGHMAGDRALTGLAEVLKTTLRPYDFSARYGGEEFLILLPNTLLEEALAVAERVRQATAVKAVLLPDGSPLPRITVSIGVATSDSGATFESMIAAADESLYRAKRGGRNRVCARESGAALETDRLVLRRFETGDAEFVLRLLNEPSFLEHIGDKGVRTLDDARRYIETGPIQSYERHGHGLYMVLLKERPEPVGMCGLLKRDYLPDVDLGYAFVPEAWGKGFALESASAVLDLAARAMGIERVLALVSPGNSASIRLLEKLGFSFERDFRMPSDTHDVRLYVTALPARPRTSPR